jgi:hypothetical protein
MRSRGQGILTIAIAGAVSVGAISLERLGPREPAAAAPGTALSSTWLCPHGGGPDYEGTVFLANPGDTQVIARVTELDAEGSAGSSEVAVPPGSQVDTEVAASTRSSSTFVETFGGWVGAGWLIRGGGGEAGVGAEPCAPEARRDWVSAAPTTGRGDDAYLVVMNPFDTDAVFDVALFSASRAPVRHAELTDVTVRVRRSIAIRLNRFAQGEDGLGVSIEVSSGRVAASTLVVSDGRGIGSVLASSEPGERQVLLTSTGTGRSVLAVAVPSVADEQSVAEVPGQLGSTFTATLRSQDPPQPADGLAEQAQDPESASVYPIATTGPSAIDLVVGEGAPIVSAVRTAGVGRDGGATAGSAAPATSWLVTPTVAGSPARPGLLVLNPGASQATVTVESIPGNGRSGSETSVSVPPGSVGVVAREFLESIGAASLLVISDGEPIVALGASTSLGNDGLSLFGLAAGVPIPGSETP